MEQTARDENVKYLQNEFGLLEGSLDTDGMKQNLDQQINVWRQQMIAAQSEMFKLVESGKGMFTPEYSAKFDELWEAWDNIKQANKAFFDSNMDAFENYIDAHNRLEYYRPSNVNPLRGVAVSLKYSG